jgi:lipopolysaccharide/colanic/teichoic acid biosynthesis glycosyltransferase
MEKRVKSIVQWQRLALFVDGSVPQFSIYSVNELQQLIRYERARSDRVGSAFSVAIFDFGSGNGNGNGHTNGSGNGNGNGHTSGNGHSAGNGRTNGNGHTSGNGYTNVKGASLPPQILVAELKRAVRATDHVGWYGAQSVGVILTCTTEDQAMMFTAKFQRRLAEYEDPAGVRVYSYHSGWLKRPGSPSGNGHGNGKNPEKAMRPVPPPPQDRQQDWSPREPLEDVLVRKMPAWKRILDISVSVAALLVVAPLLLVAGIYIKLVSPGPVIFKQKRVGYKGRLFDFYKFRTMMKGNDQSIHSAHAGSFIRKGTIPMAKLDDSDPRIIRTGRILRRTAIDELPQLFNVLKGDMSLVGPRPCLPYEAQEYLRWHTHRFDTVPGITGLWQVNGKNDMSFKEMVCLDISYCRNMSPVLDLKLLAATIPAIAGEVRKAVKRRPGRT